MRFIDPVDGVGMRLLAQAPQSMASEMSDSRMHHGTLDSLSPLHPALLEVAGTRVFKPLTTSSPHPSDLVGSYMMGIFSQTKLKPL